MFDTDEQTIEVDMKKETKQKRAKGFRIDPELEGRLQKVAKKMDLPESWFIKSALEKQMPEFEKMAKAAA